MRFHHPLFAASWPHKARELKKQYELDRCNTKPSINPKYNYVAKRIPALKATITTIY